MMRRRWLLAALISFILFMISGMRAEKPAHGPASSVRHTFGRRISPSGVPNAGEVTPNLYRGAQPTPEGFRQLKEMGIDIVVDFRMTDKDKEKREVTQLGMQYVAIPWHCYFPKDKVVAQFLILLRENRGKKIFVHCRYGDDRTGMMIAAHRMADEGWMADEARKEMDAFGYDRLRCPALGPYEKHFPEHFRQHARFRSLHATTDDAGAGAK